MEVDICALGEGEDTLVDVLTTLENGDSLESVKGVAYLDSNKKVIVTDKRNRINQLENIPWPNWDTVPLDKYFNINQGINSNYKKAMIMLATRGCPHACGFCTNDIMWNSKWIARDASDVVNEIKHYVTEYGVDNIDFVDLTIVVNREWMFKFCELLINENLGITWTIPVGTRTEGIDYSLLKVVKQSGLIRLMYVAESGSRSTLNRIEKCLVINNFNKVVKETIKLKIDVKINYIFGFLVRISPKY